jgi:hypothetical protein
MKDNEKDAPSSRLAKLPGALKHAGEGKADTDLQREALAQLEAHPGLRFLADVLTALHRQPDGLRPPPSFYTWFPPQQVLESFAQRPDLRVRIVRALTGGPAALLRRVSAAELAGQIDLLAAEDLPEPERVVRAEADRALGVRDIYLKYLDPADVAMYLPTRQVWEYEAHDSWWTRDPSSATRALMVAEWRSLRQNRLLTDGEILDIVGDEALETHLPVEVRVRMRAAARRAGREGRVFSDGDLFELRSPDGRDFIEELTQHVPLPVLRKVVAFVAAGLGLPAGGAVAESKESAANGASAARPAAPARATNGAGAARGESVTPPPILTGGDRTGGRGGAAGKGGGGSSGWIPVGRRAAADAEPPTVVTVAPKIPPPPPGGRGAKPAASDDASDDNPPLPDSAEFVTNFDDEPTNA